MDNCINNFTRGLAAYFVGGFMGGLVEGNVEGLTRRLAGGMS